MADQQIINVGSSPNDGQGDPLRVAFQKTNTNFTTLFGTAGITGIQNGTSNIGIPLANGNVNLSATGVPNVLSVGPLAVTATGNLIVTKTANIGNIIVPGTITATGTIQSIGDITAATVSASGNLNAGGYIFGDGGFLSNVTAVSNVGASQISNTTTIMAVQGAGGNIVTQINGVANIFILKTTGANIGGYLGVTGNINGTNISANGSLTVSGTANITGNVTGGNLATGNISVSVDTISGSSSIYLSPLGNVVLNGPRINGLAEPVQDQDAATKFYVDSVAQGLHVHQPANVATTADLQSTFSGSTVTYDQPGGPGNGVGATLKITGNTFSALDGVSLTSNMRILVKNQANAVTNGIYVYSNSTAFTRSSDADLSADLAGGDFIFVQSGNTLADTGWVMTSDAPVMGVGNIVWAQFSGAGSYTAGAGLTLSGGQFSVNVDNVTTAISAGNVVVKASANLTTPNIGAATGTSLSVSGNITSGNLVTAGTTINSSVSTTGNVTGGNILTAGVVSATGNVTGSYIIGNGSQLTGVTATGVAASALTGTTLSSNVITSSITTVGTLGSLAVTGNITSGNISATNHTGAAVSVSGNVTGGNILTAGVVSATGNVTGNYILGNGALLTGVITSVANINNGTSNVTVVSSGGNISVGIGGTSNVAVWATSGEYITGVISATGNITGGNLITSGTTGILSVNSITHTGTNAVGNIGSSSSYFNQVFATATTALYADVAEIYVADADYVPGTVLEFGGSQEVTIADDSTIRVAGVVSTNPAYLMNAGQEGTHKVAIALLGRVPCRVRGIIRKGDMLVSGGCGYARPQPGPLMGSVIGKALEDHPGGEGVILVVVGRL